MLIGTALLTAIHVLIQKSLFRDPCPRVRNVGLVLSLFLRFAQDWKESCYYNEDGWKYLVLQIAAQHQVPISGLAGIEEVIVGIQDSARDSDSELDASDSEPESKSTSSNSQLDEEDEEVELSKAVKLTDEHLNMTTSYESWDVGGVERSWKQCSFDIEVRLLSTLVICIGRNLRLSMADVQS